MNSHDFQALEMTPAKSVILTGWGATLGVTKAIMSTGQLGDAFLLGFAGAAGALALSLLVVLSKKSKPFWIFATKQFKAVW